MHAVSLTIKICHYPTCLEYLYFWDLARAPNSIGRAFIVRWSARQPCSIHCRKWCKLQLLVFFFEEVWNVLVLIYCVRQGTLNCIQTQTFPLMVLFQCKLIFHKLLLPKIDYNIFDNVQEVLIWLDITIYFRTSTLMTS